MKRILLPVAAVLLCLAGCGSGTAVVVVTNGPLIAAELITVAPSGAPTGIAGSTPIGRPVITPVVTHRQPTVAHPMISPTVTAPTAPAPAASTPTAASIRTAAAGAVRAMQAILPAARSGIEVFDRSTGTVLAGQATDQQFPTMSVVKLLIALDVLAKGNWATPDDAMKEQLHRMLAYSDDQVANTMWTAGGGPAIVTRMTGLLGLTGTRAPRVAGEWGDTLITSEDVVSVYGRPG